MLTYFPRYFSSRALICYVITLAVVSLVFWSYAMPFQFMLFGFGAMAVFFVYGNQMTEKWRCFSTKTFVKRLFVTSLIIRIVYVVFIYFYLIEMTGQPFAYHSGDEQFYQKICELWRNQGFEVFNNNMKEYIDLSDSGFCWWLAIEYRIMGTHVLPARLVKCVLSAFLCVFIYNIAKRNFGEYVGRMSAIFCMLMPNMWYYCGVTLKECEMTFLIILFVERADFALRSKKITLRNLLLPGIIILVMFTFRTALGAVLVAALAAALILTSSKQLQTWQKVLYSSVFAIWMLLTVGAEIIEETQQLWEGRTTNQETGYAWRAEREGGNSFAKYASASVFAPLIFTIPFSTMVAVPNQETQMMLNGAYFIKNIMSGLTIFALFTLLIRGSWRKHVLPIAVTMGYLVVLVFSNFAHSERFHFPVLAFELMFAAYGITLLSNKHKRWYVLWLVGIFLVNFAWTWFKLAGRGYSI